MNSGNNSTDASTGYSAGFTWGFKSMSNGEQVVDNQSSNRHLDEGSNQYKPRPKRRYSSEHNEHDDPVRNGRHISNRGKHAISKRKAHITSSILGQPLPIQRGLELMSKEQLQSALIDILKAYPETQQLMNSKIQDCMFGIDKCEQLLKLKLEQLYQSIPYNRSSDMNNLNDYAFVRMKPYILELLNCLVDFVLDQIPPRVENLLDSLKFLDLCTDMVTHLPRFQLRSNNYYYDKCLEQLSYVWCTLIEHIARDVYLTLNGESVIASWITKLEVYNDLSNDILSRPLQLFKSLISVDSELTTPVEKNDANARNSFYNSANNGRLANDQ